MVFFAHFLILEDLDHHQNLISSSLYYPGYPLRISSQSIHIVLSNAVHKQTDRQTNATKNITSFCQGGKKCFGSTARIFMHRQRLIPSMQEFQYSNFDFLYMYHSLYCGAVVQCVDFLPVTQEPSIRFHAGDKSSAALDRTTCNRD